MILSFASRSVFLGGLVSFVSFLCRILSGCHRSLLLSEFLCFIVILVSLLFSCWWFALRDGFEADSVEAIIVHCDLSLISFDYSGTGIYDKLFYPTPWFFFLLSCLVAMVWLITIGLPVLSLVNHPNPSPCMYTSPPHQYCLFTPISHPTPYLLSAARDCLEWALLVMDYSSHMTSVLCRTAWDSMEHLPLYSNVSFYLPTYHGLFLWFPFSTRLYIPHVPYCLISPSCIYISTTHTSHIIWPFIFISTLNLLQWRPWYVLAPFKPTYNCRHPILLLSLDDLTRSAVWIVEEQGPLHSPMATNLCCHVLAVPFLNTYVHHPRPLSIPILQ